MRTRSKILVSMSILVGFFLLLLLYPRQTGDNFNFGFARRNRAYGNLRAEHIVVFFVTNNTRSKVELNVPGLQRGYEGGRIVTDNGKSWNSQSYSVSLPPGGDAWLAYGIDPDIPRFRLRFEYRRNAGPWHAAISRAVSKLPLSRSFPRIYGWLFQHGYVDGLIGERYEGPWISNEPLATNSSENLAR